MALPDIPPLMTSDMALATAWLKLEKFLREVNGTCGFGNVIYVDSVHGDDASGARGSIFTPFASIQAALAVVEDDDVVLVGPGAYAENVVLPTGVRFTLKGLDRDRTFLVGVHTATDDPTLSWTAPAAGALAINLTIRDLTIIGHDIGANYPVYFDGSLRADAFQSGFLRLENLMLRRLGPFPQMVYFATINLLRLVDVDFAMPASTTAIEQCSEVIIEGCQFADLWIDYEAAASLPVLGRDIVGVSDSYGDELAINHVANAYCDYDVQFNTIVQTTTDATIGGTNYSGHLEYLGDVHDVDGTHAATANVINPVAIFDRARVTGHFAYLYVPVTTVHRFSVRAHNATFTTIVPGEISAGAWCDLDIRGASYPTQISVVTDDDGAANRGTVDRSLWVDSVDAPGGAAVITFVNGATPVPYPAAVTDAGAYHVSLEFNNILDAPGSVTLKSDTGFTLTTTANNDDVTYGVHRPYND